MGVRHLPSGLVVRCQQERSQARNREIAISMVKARMLEAMEAQGVSYHLRTHFHQS